ncbi:cytochrome P450 [Annulohypoxylon stygium]|nr:cytochrome P450 [Annulohypoxylon stygium]
MPVAAHRQAAERKKRDDAKGAPSTFPYIFPLLGSLPLAYLWDPKAFVLNPANFFQSAHPIRVKILTQEFYTVCGPENVKALFRKSWECTSIPFVKFAMGHAFGVSPQVLNLYGKDDSGCGPTPHAGSTVEARNRVDYRDHQSIIQFLEGKGLSPLWSRFAENITHKVHNLYDRTTRHWSYHADLMKVIGDDATVSVLNAFCGPHLLRLNPTFPDDYWVFDRNLQTYLQGIPWFLAPRAYAARKRVLDSFQLWQQYARDHFEESSIGADGDDPYWGSSFFRKRQGMFLEMDGHNYADISSQDFGLIWAARNSVTATCWVIYEIFRDPELLTSVRAEVDSCALTDADDHIRFNIDQLLRLPILQAVYAEVLRLRMDFYLVRMPDRVDMNIQNWIIPRRKAIIALTTVAHMDSKSWNTGIHNEHPLDQFWIGRFLKYPPDSGPPTFSTKGSDGSWIPYGGGPRQCLGRHFTKRQILLNTALMVSLFDCEILEGGKDVQGDSTLKGFGSGVAHPAGKVPVKIRRRDRGSM